MFIYVKTMFSSQTYSMTASSFSQYLVRHKSSLQLSLKKETKKDKKYLQAMSKVAFLLLATPSELEATHQQTPPSCSFLFCIARKKKRDPSGRSIRCELGSSGAILTGSPSLNHSIIGASGDPLARQSKVTGSFLTTVWFMGCCVITGLEAEKRNIQIRLLSLLTNCV